MEFEDRKAVARSRPRRIGTGDSILDRIRGDAIPAGEVQVEEREHLIFRDAAAGGRRDHRPHGVVAVSFAGFGKKLRGGAVPVAAITSLQQPEPVVQGQVGGLLP